MNMHKNTLHGLLIQSVLTLHKLRHSIFQLQYFRIRKGFNADPNPVFTFTACLGTGTYFIIK
jgi:hypothetical protein